MGGGNVLDQVCRPHEPPNSPASSVEVLAGGAYSECDLFNFGRKRCNPRERSVEETIIDLVREDDDLVLETEICDSLQLFLGEDLTNGII